MEKEFSYFFDWQNFKASNNLMERAVAEFAANDAKYIVLTNNLLEYCISEPNFFILFVKLLEKYGLKFSGCHGLWSGVKDLNCDDRQYRDISIANHKRAMGYAADMMGQNGSVAVMTVGAIYLMVYTFLIKKAR